MDKSQLKRDGLAFGKVFQRAFRVASLYTAEHAAAEQAVQGAYKALGDLLKSADQFTLGIHDKKVAFNDLVVTDPSFNSLEEEFGKRNFVAITFSRGIPYREFKRGLAALIVKPEVMESAGGARAYFRQISIEGMRVTEAGGNSLGMDLQSFLMAKTALDAQAGGWAPGLSSLLQSAGVAQPAGVPGNPGELLQLIGTAIQAALAASEGNPRQLSQALARSLEELPPEYLIPAFPANRQTALKGRPPAELASELTEDVAVEWVQRRWAAASDGGGMGAAERDISRVLSRVLETAQSSERLLQKLDRLFESSTLPAEAAEWTRSEMLWASWLTDQRQAYLNGLERFSEQDLGHLVEHIKELARAGRLKQATETALHFLDTLTEEQRDRTAGMARVPELIRVFSELHSLGFIRAVMDRFIQKIGKPPQDWEQHRQAANCLSAAAQSLAMFEDYEAALKGGHELERSLRSDPERHAQCCGPALESLLAPATIERLIELCVHQRPEANKERVAMSLLKLLEAPAAELVFRMLEEEKSATARSRLLQIARQVVGQGGIAAACKRLEDQRWYVVRNACYILGALDDPELPQHLGPILRHSEVRVQEAALNAILRSKEPKRGAVLAEALPALPPHLQESVLDEMLLLKDAGAIAPLQEFLAGSGARAGLLEKALKALAAMEDEDAAQALYDVLCRAELPITVRGAALSALKNSPAPLARQRLSELQQLTPGLPLIPE